MLWLLIPMITILAPLSWDFWMDFYILQPLTGIFDHFIYIKIELQFKTNISATVFLGSS